MQTRKKALTLTDAAASQVKNLLARAPKPALGLRLGLKNAGCAGQEYTLDYALNAEPLDEVIEDKNVKILVSPHSLMFLLGTRMDYQESELSSGFVFENPNQTDACGCGMSVTLKRAQAADKNHERQ